MSSIKVCMQPREQNTDAGAHVGPWLIAYAQTRELRDSLPLNQHPEFVLHMGHTVLVL